MAIWGRVYDDPMSVRILAFTGSLRKKSLNKKLLLTTIDGATEAGAEVDLIDLKSLALPIYDGDLEEESGLPPSLTNFCERVRLAQGLLIASPEHNSSLPAALKNVIDWASRDRGDAGEGCCFKGKVVALIAATPGGHGATGGLEHLRQVLENVGALTIEPQFGLAKAHEAFDEADKLIDSDHDEQARKIGEELVQALEEHDSLR